MRNGQLLAEQSPSSLIASYGVNVNKCTLVVQQMSPVSLAMFQESVCVLQDLEEVFLRLCKKQESGEVITVSNFMIVYQAMIYFGIKFYAKNDCK